MVNVGISGLGSYLPETIVTNDDLSKLMDTSDSWIQPRTGIKTRRIARANESLPIMLAVAAQRALKDAGISPSDLDFILCGTNNTDPFLIPSVAARLQYLIGAEGVPACDIGAGCTGVVYASEFGVRMIRDIEVNEKRKAKVLVLGGDTMINVTPMNDRRSAVVLADGAGACVLEPESNERCGIRYIFNKADGSRGNLIHYSSGFGNQLVGTNPARFEQRGEKSYFLMDGRNVHKFILRKASETIKEIFEKSGLDLSTLKESIIVPHQMNLRSIESFVEQLEKDTRYKPKEVYTDGVVNYGNNSTASTLIGLNELYRAGRLNLYAPVVVAAFGAGLTWGGFLDIWGKESKVLGRYDLGEQRQMVAEMNEKYDFWKKGLAS